MRKKFLAHLSCLIKQVGLPALLVEKQSVFSDSD